MTSRSGNHRLVHEQMPDRPSLDLSRLTEREHEIVSAAMTGAPVAAIAEALALSEATVRSHLAHIYAKLDVTGRIELLARANDGASNPSAQGEPARQEPVAQRAVPFPPVIGRSSGGDAMTRSRVVALVPGAVVFVLVLGVLFGFGAANDVDWGNLRIPDWLGVPWPLGFPLLALLISTPFFLAGLMTQVIPTVWRHRTR